MADNENNLHSMTGLGLSVGMRGLVAPGIAIPVALSQTLIHLQAVQILQ